MHCRRALDARLLRRLHLSGEKRVIWPCSGLAADSTPRVNHRTRLILDGS